MKKLALVFALIVGIGVATFYYFERPSKPKVDPTLAEQTFATASETDRAAVQKGIDAVRTGDFGKALVLLENLPYDLDDITPDQEAVLMDLVQQVTDMLGDQAEAAKEAAQKALDEAAVAAPVAAPVATPDSASEDATNAATQATAGAAQAADAVKAAAGQAAEDATKAAKELPNPLKQ